MPLKIRGGTGSPVRAVAVFESLAIDERGWTQKGISGPAAEHDDVCYNEHTMSTTSLFVELLIIGLEVSIWLVLLVASVTGTTWLTQLAERFEPYAALVTGVAIGNAYLLGIVVDKFAHFLVGEDRIDRFVKDADVEDGSEDARKYRQIYAQIMVEKGQPASDVLYARSKVRILRSSLLNIPLITITGIGFLVANHGGSYWWVAAVIGAFFTVLTVKGYLDTIYLYRRRLLHFKEFIKKSQEAP